MVASRQRSHEGLIGREVRFRIGLVDANGTIVEDRGPLAGQGRHLYRIAFRFDEDYDRFIELPKSDFQLIADEA
jgi:hypothetical protein